MLRFLSFSVFCLSLTHPSCFRSIFPLVFVFHIYFSLTMCMSYNVLHIVEARYVRLYTQNKYIPACTNDFGNLSNYGDKRLQQQKHRKSLHIVLFCIHFFLAYARDGCVCVYVLCSLRSCWCIFLVDLFPFRSLVLCQLVYTF